MAKTSTASKTEATAAIKVAKTPKAAKPVKTLKHEANGTLETNGSKAERLPKAQIRILTALSKHPLLNAKALSEKANVPLTHITGFTLKKFASKRTPALVELGYVKVKEIKIDPQDTKTERNYEITAAGRKALEKSEKEAK